MIRRKYDVAGQGNFQATPTANAVNGSDDRLARVREALESLKLEQLHFNYLTGIRKTLAQNRPAFIFNSGIQLRHNPLNQTTEVIFVDVLANLKKMAIILDSARDRLIAEINGQ